MIDLALAILRRQFENRFDKPDRGLALQLALRVLVPYVGKHAVIDFWNVCANDNPLQRMNNLKKVYAVIEGTVMRRWLFQETAQ